MEKKLIRNPMIPANKGSNRQNKQQNQIKKEPYLGRKLKINLVFSSKN